MHLVAYVRVPACLSNHFCLNSFGDNVLDSVRPSVHTLLDVKVKRLAGSGRYYGLGFVEYSKGE